MKILAILITLFAVLFCLNIVFEVVDIIFDILLEPVEFLFELLMDGVDFDDGFEIEFD